MQYSFVVWLMLTCTLIADAVPTDLSAKIRRKRQQETVDPSEEGLCDFGTSPDVNFCSWTSSNFSVMQWKQGSGRTAFWLGGPTSDHSTSGQKTGGYAFVDTFSSQDASLTHAEQNAFLENPLSQRTDPEGLCLQFWYSLNGLSADSLRILLITEDSSLLNPKQVLWETKDQTVSIEEPTEGKPKTEWVRGQVLFNQRAPYRIAFEALAKPGIDSSRNYRGHIALDDVEFISPVQSPGIGCKGFCSFEGGFCEWQNDNEDDFDWQLGRGSTSRLTGPSRDHGSQINGGEPGGYVYIESSYPRHPDDKARLISSAFDVNPESQPFCFKFWTHMFGSGIGSLSVYVREGGEDRKIWGVSGDSGNQWHNAQVTVAARSTFQVILEAVVGRNPLGNIAIDDITFQDGPCSARPPSAVSRQADCTFETDDCLWINVNALDQDQFDWLRVSPHQGTTNSNSPVIVRRIEPLSDHTTGQSSGFFMTLERSSIPMRNGDKAIYVSPLFKASETACLSFWVYLFERTADAMGPGLGTLRVYVRTNSQPALGLVDIGIPVWRLTNYEAPTWFRAQTPIRHKEDYRVVIEGTWGSSRQGSIAVDDISVYDDPDCKVIPKRASVVTGECSFDKSFCDWKNSNASVMSLNQWQLATPMRRPNNINDHTYQAQVGYIFFDVYNPNGGMSVRLESAELKTDPESTIPGICLSFWFLALGSSADTQLKVFVGEPEDDKIINERKIWHIRMLEITGSRLDWMFGQISLPVDNQYKIIFEGTTTNGGFAIDDIQLEPGECPTRPIEVAANEIDSKVQKPSEPRNIDDLDLNNITTKTSTATTQSPPPTTQPVTELVTDPSTITTVPPTTTTDSPITTTDSPATTTNPPTTTTVPPTTTTTVPPTTTTIPPTTTTLPPTTVPPETTTTVPITTVAPETEATTTAPTPPEEEEPTTPPTAIESESEIVPEV